MSKTTIFIILLVAGAGLAIGILTNFNPLTAIRNFIDNPASILDTIKTVPQTIQQHWQALLGIVTGAGGMLMVASKAYSNYKASRQQIEQSLETQLAETSKAKTELETAKQDLETTYATKQEEFTGTVSKLSEQLVDLSNNNETLNTTINQVTEERTMFVNKYNATAKELEEYKKKFGTLYVK